MSVVEPVEGTLPTRFPAAPFHVEVSQLLGASHRGELHAVEERVSHGDGHAVAVGHDLVFRLRSRHVQLGSGRLEFVHEAGIGRADDEAEP